MRERVLFAALLIALGGCSNSVSNVTQEPAGPWVVRQIEQSAASISLTQTHLHETSASPVHTSVSASALPTAEKQVSPTKPPIRHTPNTGG